MSWRARTGGSWSIVLAVSLGLAACGPASGPDEVASAPVPAVSDTTEATDPPAPGGVATDPEGAATGTGRSSDVDASTDAGQREATRGQVRTAPFRVPSPSEEGLTGEELRARVVAACEAEQAGLDPPPGPCVVVELEARFDPDRQPGTWITTRPPGDTIVPHGSTVVVVVADAASGRGEAGDTGPLDPTSEADARSDTGTPSDAGASSEPDPLGGERSEQPAPAAEEASGDGA